MATYTNISYAAKDVGTSPSSLVTVPSSTTVAISSLIVSNTSVSPITADVYFTRSAVDYYLVKGATIAVGGALEAIQGNRVVLIAADTLKVATSAATSADCVVSALVAV